MDKPAAPGKRRAQGKGDAAGLEIESRCTSVAASGDTLYFIGERRSGDMDAGGGGQDRVEIAGGAGVYSGVEGSCAYETGYLANDRVVTTLDCEWRRE